VVRATDRPHHETHRMTDQLSLFPTAPEAGAAHDDDVALAAHLERAAAIAARLPDTLRMGTSSWSFPGWKGIVYAGTRSTQALAREGLREYARHPLLRTVGLDRSYYAAVSPEDLRRYADQVPDDFRVCAKAPVTVTAFTVPAPGRIEPNPDFLSAERFVDEMLEPFERSFAKHCGPFLLQFAPIPVRATLDPQVFAELLDRFLEQLPRWCEYAVELRERSLMTDTYRAVIARHGVAHVCNYWSAMPSPAEQAATMRVDGGPFTMVRLLLRPGTRYEERRQEMAPFNRVVQPDERMRREVTTILRSAGREKRRTYLLVNNKAEGSAPLTIQALAERLAQDA
jgi:uncharacterized protein YecE (DUF72 family)